MKKQRLSVLLLVTIAFVGFTVGFLYGRNQEKHFLHVSVPAALQTQPPETTSFTEPPAETVPVIAFPININTADKDAFMALPGIGEVLALRILTYRDAHGNFESVEELMNVEGIGEKRMEEILDFITIGG